METILAFAILALSLSPIASSATSQHEVIAAAARVESSKIEALAQRHCLRDEAVWLNARSGIYYVKEMRWYASTEHALPFAVKRQTPQTPGIRETGTNRREIQHQDCARIDSCVIETTLTVATAIADQLNAQQSAVLPIVLKGCDSKISAVHASLFSGSKLLRASSRGASRLGFDVSFVNTTNKVANVVIIRRGRLVLTLRLRRCTSLVACYIIHSSGRSIG